MESPKKTPCVNWVYKELMKPSCGRVLWNLMSTITLTGVGLFCKLWIFGLNKAKIHNRLNFYDIIEKRPPKVPVITVSNHHSCFDDPGIWGCMKAKYFFQKTIRWSLAAHDICFTNAFNAYFFATGKCIPVIRGLGVYQKAIDMTIEKLKNGEWVHMFPEGKVNETQEFIRFKWGVGRLIYEAPVTPIVVPIWHIGMDDILPNKTPYILKTGKKATFNFGEPIDLNGLLAELRANKVTAEFARKAITDRIQNELLLLKKQTESLHKLYHNC